MHLQHQDRKMSSDSCETDAFRYSTQWVLTSHPVCLNAKKIHKYQRVRQLHSGTRTQLCQWQQFLSGLPSRGMQTASCAASALKSEWISERHRSANLFLSYRSYSRKNTAQFRRPRRQKTRPKHKRTAKRTTTNNRMQRPKAKCETRWQNVEGTQQRRGVQAGSYILGSLHRLQPGFRSACLSIWMVTEWKLKEE